MMLDNTTEFIDKEIERMVKHFQTMRLRAPNMFHDTMRQYANMANGGIGGDALAADCTATTIRHDYYKGYPDSFFVTVLSALGEFERYTTMVMENKQC